METLCLEGSEDTNDTAELKLVDCTNGACYAPGVMTQAEYVEMVKGAPKTSTVLHFQLQKSRYREPHECPWHLTFSSGLWDSFLKDFLVRLETNPDLEEGSEAQARAQSWAFRKYRPRTGPSVGALSW